MPRVLNFQSLASWYGKAFKAVHVSGTTKGQIMNAPPGIEIEAKFSVVDLGDSGRLFGEIGQLDKLVVPAGFLSGDVPLEYLPDYSGLTKARQQTDLYLDSSNSTFRRAKCCLRARRIGGLVHIGFKRIESTRDFLYVCEEPEEFTLPEDEFEREQERIMQASPNHDILPIARASRFTSYTGSLAHRLTVQNNRSHRVFRTSGDAFVDFACDRVKYVNPQTEREARDFEIEVEGHKHTPETVYAVGLAVQELFGDRITPARTWKPDLGLILTEGD